MAFPTRIYLTGFMGSGKSTIGPMVANVLGHSFADLDERIEADLGESIPDFFARAGEPAFREVEARALRTTGTLREHVIALGGGTLVQPENLRFALDRGVVVYLKWTAASLTERLSHSTHRPLLYDDDGRPLSHSALEARIRTLLDAREPYYGQAHVSVSLDGFSIGWSVDRVVDALRAWGRTHRGHG